MGASNPYYSPLIEDATIFTLTLCVLLLVSNTDSCTVAVVVQSFLKVKDITQSKYAKQNRFSDRIFSEWFAFNKSMQKNSPKSIHCFESQVTGVSQSRGQNFMGRIYTNVMQTPEII